MEEHSTLYRVMKEILAWAIYLAIAILLALFILKFVADKSEVSGNSMNDTLQNQDIILLEKVSYRFTTPKRYDIIVFPFEKDQYVKRIIGLPGETIQIEKGKIYIDGKILDDDVYGKSEILEGNEGIAANPVKIGKNEYFVLGDNRNDSSDSRNIDIGPIKEKKIIGKVCMRLAPFKKFGFIKKDK